MNKIVNANFTGEELKNLRGNNYTKDQWNDIFQDVFSYMYITDKYDNCSDKHNIMLMIKAMIEINTGFDQDDEIIDFLERIDSTLVYHKNIKDMTPRELLCMYMNSICKWSSIMKHDFGVKNDEELYRLRDLYDEMKTFILEDLGLPRRRILNYKDFRTHLKRHALVKPSGAMFNTVKLRAESVCGLPQQKIF